METDKYPNAGSSLIGHPQVYDDSKLRRKVSLLISGLFLCFVIAIVALGVAVMVLIQDEELPSSTTQGQNVSSQANQVQQDKSKQTHESLKINEDIKKQIEELTRRMDTINETFYFNTQNKATHAHKASKLDPALGLDLTVDTDYDEISEDIIDIDAEPDHDQIHSPHHHGGSIATEESSLEEGSGTLSHDHHNHEISFDLMSTSSPSTNEIEPTIQTTVTAPSASPFEDTGGSGVSAELCKGDDCTFIEGSGNAIFYEVPIDDYYVPDSEYELGSGILVDDCMEFPRPVCPEGVHICLTNDRCPVPVCCIETNDY